jgi:5-methyltetrahydrofolate--homocysteine methyltransferase
MERSERRYAMEEKDILERISFNVIQGRVEAEDEGFDGGLEGQAGATELVEDALAQGVDPKSIVINGLTEAMEVVGEKFEKEEYLIPDMLASAECVGASMDILSPHLLQAGVENKGKFVIATVAGDLHDIGKNIVAIMLKGAGYEVIDLGNDVATEKIAETVRESQAPFLGLSALLTTTMRAMGEVVERLEQEGLRDKVTLFIGGAPTSKEFADEIGADVYCKDAFQAIDVLKGIASSA